MAIINPSLHKASTVLDERIRYAIDSGVMPDTIGLALLVLEYAGHDVSAKEVFDAHYQKDKDN